MRFNISNLKKIQDIPYLLTRASDTARTSVAVTEEAKIGKGGEDEPYVQVTIGKIQVRTGCMRALRAAGLGTVPPGTRAPGWGARAKGDKSLMKLDRVKR